MTSEPTTHTGRLLLNAGLTFHSGRRLADNPELVAQIEAEARTEADAQIVALRKIVAEERFKPTGDNHHNAALCPYCNPNGTLLNLASPEAEKALNLGRQLLATGYVDEHFVTFTERGYGLEHPIRCRPDLNGCIFNEWLATQLAPDREPGRYLMTWGDADPPQYEVALREPPREGSAE